MNGRSVTADTAYDAAVQAWAAHLRAGGTRPWDSDRWSRAAGGEVPPPAPSAVHLELLRRFNLAGLGPVPSGLADLLLSTPRPGRGLVDPPLPWSQAPRFGSPPLLQTDLHDDLLLTLGVGVLVRLLSRTAPPPPQPGPRPRRRSSRALLGRVRFELHGTRAATAVVRERLLAAGAVEGGRRPLHLVLGLPLEQAMADHWTGRISRGGTLTWGALWRRAAAAGRLPHPVDVDRIARRLIAEGSRVHLVLGPDHGALADAAAQVLGQPARAVKLPGLQPSQPLRPARWDLQRRVNRLVPLAQGPVSGTALTRRLVPALDEATRPGPDETDRTLAPLALPAPATHAPFAAHAAADLARRVRRGDYPVHGDPELVARLGPRGPTGRPGTLDASETLDIALTACLRLWRTQEGASHVEQESAPAPTGQQRGPGSGPTRRVLLHVGTPKTGTSFVQDILFTHRDALRDRGILYAADRPDAHFMAALDLLQLPWGGLEREASGRWKALVDAVRSWPGDAIVSHEILGTASREQAAQALADLGGDDTELHVVVSARDLVRQLPAEWQENVKHRRRKTYSSFLAELRDPARATEVAQWFWAAQELPDVLRRWTGGLPAERVHVVTVPRPGGVPTLLWERFAGLFGIDPEQFQPSARANASLGVPESAMLRRLNVRVRHVLPNHHYRSLVREMVVHRNLSGRPGSVRLELPHEVHAWAADLAASWVEELRRQAYDVVGDLDDLLPDDPRPFVDPDAPDEAAVADAALDALAIMTAEAAKLRDVEVELHEVIADLMGQIDALHATPGYRAKEKLVALAHRNPVARVGYAGYRRLRGSSSRST